jgi:hypothetical protein
VYSSSCPSGPSRKKVAKRERGSKTTDSEIDIEHRGAERKPFSGTRGADGDSHSRKSRNGPECVYYTRRREDLAAREY